MGMPIEDVISKIEKNNSVISSILAENEKLAKDLKNRTDDEWDWVSVSVACKVWDICPATMYQRINRGKLKTRRFENKVYVSLSEIKAINDKVAE